MRNSVTEDDLAFIIASPLPWETFEGKNIVISGANGMLPFYLVQTILFLNENRFNKTARVFAIVRNKEKAYRRYEKYIGTRDFVLLVQDINDPVVIHEDVHFIIHAASQASPKFFVQDPVGTFSPNVFGTRNLLELGRAKGVEGFLFVSSCEVYGQGNSDLLLAEDAYGYVDPTNIRSCYAEGKRAGEVLCVCWQQQYGVPIKIARPFHTYGPGMSIGDGRVFADFVFDIVHERNLVMKSDGSARRAFCYIADATVGFFTVLLRGEPGQAYNVGNMYGEMSVLGLAELLVSLFPEKHLRIERATEPEIAYVQSQVKRYAPDTTKLCALGWFPKYSVKDGFARTIQSFSESNKGAIQR